jgi:K+ transporter
MGITTLLLAIVARALWREHRDAGRIVSAARRVTVFALMTTWRRGRIILTQRVTETAISEEDFLRDLAAVRAGSASSASPC